MRKIFFLLVALLLLKSVKYYSGQASGLCAPQGGLMEVSQADRVYQLTATDRESFFISPRALLQMRASSWLWVLPEHHRSQQYSLIHQGNAPEKIFFKKLSIVSWRVSEFNLLLERQGEDQTWCEVGLCHLGRDREQGLGRRGGGRVLLLKQQGDNSIRQISLLWSHTLSLDFNKTLGVDSQIWLIQFRHANGLGPPGSATLLYRGGFPQRGGYVR